MKMAKRASTWTICIVWLVTRCLRIAIHSKTTNLPASIDKTWNCCAGRCAKNRRTKMSPMRRQKLKMKLVPLRMRPLVVMKRSRRK
uniref:Putative secreted protein n=1 Tax=Anopheles marajoara TaxID=58244 RepID=A0A2M4CAP0_9DIPT